MGYLGKLYFKYKEVNLVKNILIILLLTACLFAVRAFQSDLFYDPLIIYFRNDYLYTTIPEIEQLRFFLNLFFRYLLNSIISLAILWFLFKRASYIKFSLKFYGFAFLCLSIVLMFFVITKFRDGYLFPFYVRRFLIHPLFLFLLIPAFYYKKRFR